MGTSSAISTRKLLAFILTAIVASNAWGYPAPAATTPVQGSYTVSYVPACEGLLSPDGICAFAILQEKVGATGSWTGVSSNTGSISFSSKPPGTYSYRVYAAAWEPVYGYLETYSTAVSVVVGPGGAVREDMLSQLQYRYEVKQGDVNGDGRTDLFVRKTAGGDPFNGTIERVILEQSPNGSFSTRVPTSGQSITASQWPVSKAKVFVRDINVDGYVDVTLTNVSAAVGGEPNQIVYAPGRVGASEPQGLRAIDDSVIRFAENSLDYFADANYFVDNVPVYYYQYWIWYGYCVPYGDYGFEGYAVYFPSCYIDYYYVSGYYADISAFSPEAIDIFLDEADVASGYISQADAIAHIEKEAEGLIGSSIGGWPMEEVLGATGDHTDAQLRRSLEIFWAILGIGRADADEVQPDEAPPQAPRSPDTIYVTSRVLPGTGGRRHSSLEYTNPSSVIGATEWISAHDTIDNPLIDGKLIAEYRWKNDNPIWMMTVGTARRPGTVNDIYWNKYLLAANLHFMGLPASQRPDYDLLPEVGSGGNNSNSYIAGIVDATNGIAFVPPGMSNTFPGWQTPVPASYFH